MLDDILVWLRLAGGVAVYPSWWFLVYLFVPLTVVVLWWVMARKKSVDVANAWSETGRHWKGMGWAGIIASVVLYVGAALWFVPSVPVLEKNVTILQAFREGVDRKFSHQPRQGSTVVFVKDWYAWLHALPVTLLVCGGLWMLFTRPGGLMACEETDLASAE